MNMTYDKLIQKLLQQAITERIPMNGSFELTTRCNLNCNMCYVHNQTNDCTVINKELSADQWISLASDARDAGTLNLVLTGGEVFLRQDFNTIYEHISKMGFQVTIYTNGTLIDENKAKWLGKIPPSTVEITLYGASAETYERICGNANAYLDVTNAIDYLLAEGINVKLKTTVTKENKEDCFALVEFAKKRNLPLSVVDYLFPARSAVYAPPHNRLAPDELHSYRSSILGNNKIDIVIEQHNLETINELSKKDECAFSCNAGSCNFWITYDGRMIPCGVLEELAALPLNIGFINAWLEICSLCAKVPECKECKVCDVKAYCDVCPAKLKSETGLYDQPADYLCTLARLTQQDFFKQSI